MESNDSLTICRGVNEHARLIVAMYNALDEKFNTRVVIVSTGGATISGTDVQFRFDRVVPGIPGPNDAESVKQLLDEIIREHWTGPEEDLPKVAVQIRTDPDYLE